MDYSTYLQYFLISLYWMACLLSTTLSLSVSIALRAWLICSLNCLKILMLFHSFSFRCGTRKNVSNHRHPRERSPNCLEATHTVLCVCVIGWGMRLVITCHLNYGWHISSIHKPPFHPHPFMLLLSHSFGGNPSKRESPRASHLSEELLHTHTQANSSSNNMPNFRRNEWQSHNVNGSVFSLGIHTLTQWRSPDPRSHFTRKRERRWKKGDEIGLAMPSSRPLSIH